MGAHNQAESEMDGPPCATASTRGDSMGLGGGALRGWANGGARGPGPARRARLGNEDAVVALLRHPPAADHHDLVGRPARGPLLHLAPLPSAHASQLSSPPPLSVPLPCEPEHLAPIPPPRSPCALHFNHNPASRFLQAPKP